MFLLFLHIVCYIKRTGSSIYVHAGTFDIVEYLIYFFGLVNIKNAKNMVVFLCCLQQSDLEVVRHGEHLPGFSFCICLFLTLFFTIWLLAINSLRFLFCLNAVIGWQSNNSFRDSFIASKFQYFHITLQMFVQKRL